MNPKILGAFAAGVVASGAIFYFTTNRQSAPRAPAAVQVAVAKPAEPPVPEPPKSTDPEPSKPAAPAPAKAEPRPPVRQERWPSAAKALAGSAAVAPVPAASILAATSSNTGQARELTASPSQSSAAQPSAAPVESAKQADALQPEGPRAVEASPATAAPVAATPVTTARREPVPLTPPSSASLPPPSGEARKVTLSGGTLFSVRLTEALSSERNKSGDTFRATLDQPVIVDGLVIAERGSPVEGRIVEAEKGGRTKGTSRLQLELTRFTSSDGQMVGVRTASYDQEGSSGGSAKSDAAKVAIGAAAGAVLGGILGGGKGAGIGAATGGAAGGGVVLATRGKPVEVPAETRLTFRLSEPVVITEKLNR